MGARRVERLADLKKDLESRFKVKVIISALDVTDEASCKAFFDAIPAEVRDNIDVLVNNAGTAGMPGPIYASQSSDLDKLINTNVKGVVKMITLFVPGMLKRGVGHIINVSSTVGKESGPFLGIYSGLRPSTLLCALNWSRPLFAFPPFRLDSPNPSL